MGKYISGPLETLFNTTGNSIIWILHIRLECIGGFVTLSKNNLLGLGYGLFSLHKPHLIHRYQEAINGFKHMCVLVKHRQDDRKTLRSPWQVWWTWRQCRSHNELLTAKDFTRGILRSIWSTQEKIKDQGQENWVQARVALAKLTIDEPRWHPLLNKLKVHGMGRISNYQNGCRTPVCYKHIRSLKVVSSDVLIHHTGLWQKSFSITNLSTVTRSAEKDRKWQQAQCLVIQTVILM